MKVAFVGKGGSGKSACTWLFAEALAALGKNIYVIDADHNMDTAATFGVPVTVDTVTFHRSHTGIRNLLGLPAETRWQTLLESPAYPTAIPLTHPTLAPLWHNTANSRIKVAVVGLGADDILGSGKCAHGHSAPLKWLLPSLTPTANEVILIDGVAGADMMNYGLYAGVDSLVIVAEHHPNSERVAEQIIALAKETKIPYCVLGNRSRPQLTVASIDHIASDQGVTDFTFETVLVANRAQAEQLYRNISIRDTTCYRDSLMAV